MTDSAAPAPTTTRPGGPLLPVYRGLLALFLLAGAAQIFLAGFGVWGHDFTAHRILGFTMAGLAVVVLVLALVTRAGTRDVVLALVLVLLAGGAQSLLAEAGGDGAFWGGLHALDGLAILGIAGFLHGAAIRRGRTTTAA
jgi:hypothetical protein